MRVMNELYLCFENGKRLRLSGGNIFLIPFVGCNMVTVPTLYQLFLNETSIRFLSAGLRIRIP